MRRQKDKKKGEDLHVDAMKLACLRRKNRAEDEQINSFRWKSQSRTKHHKVGVEYRSKEKGFLGDESEGVKRYLAATASAKRLEERTGRGHKVYLIDTTTRCRTATGAVGRKSRDTRTIMQKSRRTWEDTRTIKFLEG